MPKRGINRQSNANNASQQCITLSSDVSVFPSSILLTYIFHIIYSLIVLW